MLILTSCTYSDYTPYTDNEENTSDHTSRAAEPSEEGGAGELTGKLVIMTNASGGTFEAMNEVFARFMEENPGVEIEGA